MSETGSFTRACLAANDRLHRPSDTRFNMVLRPSPQESSMMTQEPVASVNGVYPGRTSQIGLERTQTGPDSSNASNENQQGQLNDASSSSPRSQHPLRQPSTKQISERSKTSSWLTNGSGGREDDTAVNTPEVEHQDNWQMRHGWEDQYNSEEYLSLLSSVRNS